MTICIGIICKDNSSLILAADSMLTNRVLSIQFEHATKKMTCLSDNCVALTAGDALAHTELFNKVQKEIGRLKSPSTTEIVDKIKECYQISRKQEIMERILIPRGFNDFGEFYEAQRTLIPDIAMSIQNEIDRYEFGLDIIVVGITEGVAHIYGIANPGTSECFDSVGFHAIGSGLPHSLNTLIARECNQNNSLEEGLLIVYEAKKMAEKAPGVGSTITDICILTPEKKVDFPRDKIEELDKIYEKWVRRESEWEDNLKSLLDGIGVYEHES